MQQHIVIYRILEYLSIFITVNIVRLYIAMPWKTNIVLLVSNGHRYFGWGIILVSQFVIGSGSVNFYSYDGKDTLGWTIAGVSAALFFIGLIVGEILHQVRLRKEIDFVAPADTIDQARFAEMIANGRKLVVLDDLVLDVDAFISQHPGGRFVLQHNIGRDVSKFFYGGYSLEGNLGQRPAKGHPHSALARMIVNDLAIAKYCPE